MIVTVSDLHGVPIARVEGDVDMETAPELAVALRRAVPNAALGLVLDLTGTLYLDSVGVHLLFETAERLRRRQQRLAVVVEPESLIEDIVQATDFGSYAGIDFELTAAVRRMYEAA